MTDSWRDPLEISSAVSTLTLGDGMRTCQKIFGVLALVLGALSFTPFGSAFAWGALKPAAAILFGAYLICKLLAPEYAKYNKERQERLARAERTPQRPLAEEHTPAAQEKEPYRSVEPYRPVGKPSAAGRH